MSHTHTHTLKIPDVERYWHHSVEDDDVGPESEEGRKRRAHVLIPRHKACELWPLVELPDAVTHGQDDTHQY